MDIIGKSQQLKEYIYKNITPDFKLKLYYGEFCNFHKLSEDDFKRCLTFLLKDGFISIYQPNESYKVAFESLPHFLEVESKLIHEIEQA